MTQEFPDEFLRTSVPKLLDFIEVNNPPANSTNNEISEEKMTDYLDSLAACSASHPVGKVIVPHLVKVMVERKERKEDYGPLVQSLSTIIEEGSIGLEGGSFIDFVSGHLSEIITMGIDARSNGKTILYAQLVGIIRTLIKRSDASRQQELIDSFWNGRVGPIKLEDLAQMNVIPVS